MGKAKTLSFILEIPLWVEKAVEKILLARLEAGRQLYNACLGEALRRWRLVAQSKAYQAARDMPHKTEEERVARGKAFSKARQAHGFSDFGLQMYALELRRSWLGGHIDSFTAQKLATRAFAAVERIALGKARRVRFKGKNQMDTLEGKSNKTGIRWRNGAVEWAGLALSAIIDDKDPMVTHGLSCRVKYVRLVRRKINGANRFYAQLVLEGEPCRKLNPDGSVKYPMGKGTVGLDAGPSTLAAVGEKNAVLSPFCGELVPKAREIRLLQRKLDRSRRANNPDNYNPNGTVRKGPKRWVNSTGYRATRSALADLHRRLAAHRKSLHGKMVNSILSLGDVFLFESVSIRGWQRRFGRSVGFRAPGRFFAELVRKAESAGGQTVPFSTRTTALSQVCHCGNRTKKKLSERWHRCPACGAHVQRDLYSAFLARFVEPMAVEGDRIEWHLNAGRASEAWPGGDALLRAAVECLQAEKTNGRVRGVLPASLGLKSSGSESVAAKIGATVGNGGSQRAKTQDAVRGPRGQESLGEAAMGSSGRTLRL